MRKQSLKSSLILLLTAFIWGVAFVAQKDGMNYVEPFTMGAVRNFLGALVLLAALPLLDRFRARGGGFDKGSRRAILAGGALCGAALFVASNLQQFGIALQDPGTNVGKAGFITACYTVFVPLFGLFVGRRSPALVWVGAAIAIAGFFCLSLMDGLAVGEGLTLGLSDLLLLLCAFAFSVQILLIDRFAPLADGVRISCVQFFVCGLLCVPGMLLFEHPTWQGLLAGWLPLAYAGVFSSGVAYTLQIIGQKGAHPAVASLILSLESVIGVLAGYVLMPGSTLTMWELIGSALVFAAVVMVQLAPTDAASVDNAAP